MKKSVFGTSYRIEMRKLFRRKDTWLLFTLLLVPLLYAIGMSTGSSIIVYSGSGNINALQFIGNMFIMAHTMFIYYVIIAIITMRSFAAEVEEKSILLYIPRLRNRISIYLSKLLSILSIVAIVMFVFSIITIALYFIFLCQRPDVASGKFLDSSTVTNELINIAAVFFLFVFSACMVSLLSMIVKGVTSVIIYIIAIVGFNLLAEYSIVQYASPWFYLNQIMAPESQAHLGSLFLGNCIYVCVMFVTLATIGIRIFNKKDL